MLGIEIDEQIHSELLAGGYKGRAFLLGRMRGKGIQDPKTCPSVFPFQIRGHVSVIHFPPLFLEWKYKYKLEEHAIWVTRRVEVNHTIPAWVSSNASFFFGKQKRCYGNGPNSCQSCKKSLSDQSQVRINSQKQMLIWRTRVNEDMKVQLLVFKGNYLDRII